MKKETVSIEYDKDRFVHSKILSPKSTRWVFPREVPATKPVERLVEEAFNNPINSKRFDDEKIESAAILVSDNTRVHTPYLQLLVRKLEAKTDEVKIVIASGTHVVPEIDFVEKVAGRELLTKFWYKIRNSSTQNPLSKYEFVGVTSRGTIVELNKEILECDFILSSLCVRPHYFAGWEGGAKALVPGCASLRTVSKNHSLSVGNMDSKELIIKGNPVREDMNEVPSLLKKERGIEHRIIDFVPNKDDIPVLVGYGEAKEAHQTLADYSQSIYAVKAQPAALVIAVAEMPLGQNFYQALKACSHATNIVKPNNHPKSVTILVASMKNGIGSKTFEKEMRTYSGMEPKEVLEKLKERAAAGDFNEALEKVNRLAVDKPLRDYLVVSPEAPSDLKAFWNNVGVTYYEELDDAIESLKPELLTDVLIISNGCSTVPIPA